MKNKIIIIFVGYDQKSKRYKFYNPNEGKIEMLSSMKSKKYLCSLFKPVT